MNVKLEDEYNQYPLLLSKASHIMQCTSRRRRRRGRIESEHQRLRSAWRHRHKMLSTSLHVIANTSRLEKSLKPALQ